jgi:hypothetical protein
MIGFKKLIVLFFVKERVYKLKYSPFGAERSIELTSSWRYAKSNRAWLLK